MSPLSSPRRIALVSAFPPGTQTLNEYGLHLAKAFAARPDVAEVVIIADRLPTPLPELDLGPKLRVRRVWDFNSPLAGARIVAALRRERVDGAVFNLQMASFGNSEVPAALGLLAPLAARLAGIPSGVIAHNLISGVDLEQTQLKGQVLRQKLVRLGGAVITRALLAANYLTVTLESYRADLKARYPGAPVILVPHGTFDTECRALVPSHLRPNRIVTMGKFGTYKRLETLIAAVRHLRDQPGFADLELVIGGTDHPNTPGYLASVAERCAGEAGLHFHGYVAEDDIPTFFAEARASVFDYSTTTGSSGVLHQTACYGAVPVFPRIGDFVDVCRDEGIDGATYAPGDVLGMADAIASVLADPGCADRLAEANRAAALGMPISAVAEVHMTLLAQRPKSRPLPAPVSAKAAA
ncbi:glycosyltransferase [Tabrizicola aquatica]|uniref:glycosyltransferase n=1 Tax=Tabrizicola aquatica TaxID=909926 RepID=UPI000CCFE9DC|nr:glycosyltransferase [Tabrizicola aquatica]